MLDTHLKQMLQNNVPSTQYWRNLSPKERAETYARWQEIESITSGDSDTIGQLHLDAHNITKKIFLTVQEKTFEYLMIRKDWIDIVRSQALKQQLYNNGLKLISEFINRTGRKARLLGGIKTDESIRRKIRQQGEEGNMARAVLDLWDVVRFKIVLRDLPDVLFVAEEFWREFFDGVVRCRNYYYLPRNNDVNDPYRAVHFELADEDGSIIEVQVCSVSRDAVSLLDHPYSFKKILPYKNDEHECWLRTLSVKANLLEVAQFKKL